MKEIKKIDAFFVVLDYTNIRFTPSIRKMFQAYHQIFGDQFVKKIAFILTHWEYSENAETKRGWKKITKDNIKKQISDEFLDLIKIKNVHNELLPCFFLDNEIGQFNINNEKELELFSKEELTQMI